MTRPFDPLEPAKGAELQIDHLRTIEATEATIVVRCLRGPVHLGAHFDHISDPDTSIDLKLTRILVYGRSIDSLYPVHTSLVTLQGSGIHLLRAGNATRGWQSIQGTNPPSPDHRF